MSTQDRNEAILKALHHLVTSGIPAPSKRILIELTLQAMRDGEDAIRRQQPDQDAEAEWQGHETEALQAFLQGRIASSWQHADEILMHLATRLRRKPADVRSKATELGFGASVDYRLSRQHTAHRTEES